MAWKKIMEAVVEKVKATLSEAAEVFGEVLTPEQAEGVSSALTEAMDAGWVEGFRAYLEQHETGKETVEREGVVYRYKLDSQKQFLTPAGWMVLNRRVYQPDAGGKCFVPLDAAWGMEDEFATVEVREAALYAVALLTPKEVETLLEKCARFRPSETAIKTMARKMGRWLEEQGDELLESIREEEEVPQQTRVLCASLDGTNVLLAEAGKKRGRPAERPRDGSETAEEDSPTSYKNAMVASVSLYGEVPQGKVTPERLASRYAARMPEERGVTLKAKFEAELRQTESRLSDGVVRMALCDGARGLWKYLDDNEAFEGWEKLVDFHHSTEHLSRAAEAMFGKGSEKAKRWYGKYRGLLLEEEDGAEKALRSMDYYAQARKLRGHRGESLETERTFFANNRHRMEYARFRRNGWPIGSGPVEAACKTLVKARLGRSGMRWSRDGGQHILTLRTYIKSDRWNAMWSRYKNTRRLSTLSLAT